MQGEIRVPDCYLLPLLDLHLCPDDGLLPSQQVLTVRDAGVRDEAKVAKNVMNIFVEGMGICFEDSLQCRKDIFFNMDTNELQLIVQKFH